MTATDELRRLLNERGVRWTACSKATIDNQTYCYGHTYTEFQSGLMVSDLTPEQAIAATLGNDGVERSNDGVAERGTCHNVAEPDEYSDRPFTCSECGARGPYGDGTYHLASGATLPDGTVVFGDAWPVWKYCPNCGREVIE